LVYIDKLNELDTEGIEPLIFLTEEFNTMAEDIQQPPLSKDEALHNAPQRDSDYFKVPKFLDRD
jgi:aspartyl-tRNA(Asn)/glutamyl-tRNA(Gln) amidotransferase subunit C